MLGVSSASCGGAERFFSQFFMEYSSRKDTSHDLYFLLDPGTFDVLSKLTGLKKGPNVIVLKNYSNRFKRVLENINISRTLRKIQIDILHVTNYGAYYFNRLYHISKKDAHPAIVINIVDCEIPYALEDSRHPKHSSYKKRYMPLFNEIVPDAVFTWYELFLAFAAKNKLLKDSAICEAAQTRFADTKGFTPAPVKKDVVVYAARLTDQKRPLMFAEAVRYLTSNFRDRIAGWKFAIYGSGPLENEVDAFIQRNQLSEILHHYPAGDLRHVFAESTCFVSTQDYENFPSLSMNEAMAAGNIIVARNVGQTSRFLEENKNGFFADTDDAVGIAGALLKMMGSRVQFAEMMKHSVYLANEVHTPSNFIRQIDTFWTRLK
jgi:glycosyltransferase involved in cell wall biosynthesis